MSLDPKGAAALALHRFGLGPRGGFDRGDRVRPARCAAGRAGATRRRPHRSAMPDLLSSAQPSRAAFEFRAERQARQIVAQARSATVAASDGQPNADGTSDGAEHRRRGHPPAAPQLNARAADFPQRSEGALRCGRRRRDRLCRAAGLVLVEPFLRLRRQACHRMAGAYEREAIRPHVLGRFADMLLAVESHPAMLFYLDNCALDRSELASPASTAAAASTRISRAKFSSCIRSACAAVYTQDDVTSFAKVLTGWTIVPTASNPEHGGEFVFNPRMHEPGPQTVIGKSLCRQPASSRAARCSPISRAIPRPRSMSRTSSRAISLPTSRRRRWSSGWRDASSTPTAISRRSPRRWSPRRRPGTRGASEAQAAERMAASSAMRARPASRADARRAIAGAGAARRAAVAAAGAEGLFRRQRAPGSTAWRSGSTSPTASRERVAERDRSEAVDRDGARAARIGGDAADHRARRKPAAGAGAAADGAGIPAEMTMSRLHARDAPRAAARLRRAVRLGATCRSSRAPRAAIRACSSSCCAARSTASPRSRRSAIRTGSSCAATSALVLDGKTPALPLDGFFALNPAMPNLHRLYQAGQATIVHAAATPYRERSHFDGQDVLESGLRQARRQPIPAGSTARSARSSRRRASIRKAARAFAVGPVTPLVVRGPAPVMSWTPPRLPPASDDTMMRLLDLYRHTDPELARVLEERIGLAAIARAGGMDAMAPTRAAAAGAAASRAGARLFRRGGRHRGEVSRAPGRPARRRARASTAGTRMSTRARSTAGCGDLLGALDGAHRARSRPTWATPGARPWWRSSPSSAAPRASTAPTAPTTAPRTVALLAGGALKGGRVIADWPGLKDADLHENRDLKATTDLRAVLKGVLRGSPARRSGEARRDGVPGQCRGRPDGRVVAFGLSAVSQARARSVRTSAFGRATYRRTTLPTRTRN